MSYGLSPSIYNDSSTTLSAGATFTGQWIRVAPYNTITVGVKTDQDGTLYMEFSPDGINSDFSREYSISAGIGENHRLTVSWLYYRTRFTNTSSSAQTYFRLQTLLGSQQPPLSAPLNVGVQHDSDAQTTRAVLYGENDAGNFTAVPVDDFGHIEMAVHSPLNPFGSVHTESLTPILQHDAVYGLDTVQQLTTTNASGSVTSSGSMFVCSTGASSGGAGSLQSRARLRYRPGQGMVARWTALYDSRVETSYSLVGFGHAEDGVAFGYAPNSVHGSTEFGIIYWKSGVRETQTLTITVASSTTENITITLNTVAFSVPVTNSGSTTKTAYEISTFSYTGWKAEQVGATVVFVADAVGNKTGTFTLSGATTAVGSFSETKAGAATTETFIPQSTWSNDRLDGSLGTNNPSGVTLNPQKINVYQVGLQYLGGGPIVFKIEVGLSDNNPELVTVHTINYPNANTTPSFGNPSFPFLMSAYSFGSTTDFSVKSASYAGFVEGQKKLNGNRFSFFGQKASVDAAAYYAILTIRNTRYYKGRSNQSVVNLLSIAGALKHNNPCTVYIFRNATLAGTPSFSQYSSQSVCYTDSSATTCTISDNNQIIWSGSLGDTGSFDHEWGLDVLTIQPGETITIAAKTAFGTASYVIASLNTREDQ